MNRWFSWRWLIASVSGGILFLFIALDLYYQGLLFQWDHRIAEPLYQFTWSNETRYDIVLFVTNLGQGRFISAVACLNVIFLLTYRKWWAAFVLTIGQWMVHFIPPWLKEQFARPRPPFLGWEDYSFPSGHAFGSAAIFGTSLFLTWNFYRGSRFRWLVATICGFLIIGIAASRPLYGVHYLSDVLAGLVLGLSYSCLLWGIGRPQTIRQSSVSERSLS